MRGVRAAVAAIAGAVLPLILIYCAWGLHARIGAYRAAMATIAFIPPVTADDIWEPAHLGAMTALRGSRQKIHWNGPAFSDDVATQVQLLQQAVASRVRGIILAPVYSSALMVPVEQALRRGADIVVVGKALQLPPTIHLRYVLNDEAAAGRLLATRLAEVLDERGRVGVVGMDPASADSAKRLQALQTALGAGALHLRIVACRQGANSQWEAERTTRELLRDEPRLQAVVALTPAATAGAFAAVEEISRFRRPTLIGAGQDYSSLYRLSEGQIDSLLVENTFQMGVVSAQLLSGNAGSSSISEVLIPPVLVTRDTMLRPALTRVLTHLRGAGL